MERTTREECGIEDIGIAPSARTGQKPVTLRERKLGSGTLALKRYTCVGLLSLITAALKPVCIAERGHRSGPEGR